MTRGGADRCPGLSRPFVSGDGAIVRVRVPGGAVTTAALATLSRIAARHGGDPDLSVTSRGALQLRGLPDPLPAPLVDELVATGLFPSAAHELARNVLADPFDPVAAEVAAAYDALLLDDPLLGGLPGRFLVGVAGPAGWVLGAPLDVAWLPDEIRVAGHRAPCSADRAPAALAATGQAFLHVRAGDPGIWTVADLTADARAELLRLLSEELDLEPMAAVPAPSPPSPGVHGADDLLVGLPLGLLTPEQVRVLASVTEQVRVTPWRSVALTGGARYADQLASVGLLVDATSAATRVTACPGAPSCHRGRTPTVPFVREVLPRLVADGPRIHVVGCGRGCGRPAQDHVLVLEPEGPGAVLAADRTGRAGTAYPQEGGPR
ncbi:precorrin-3B synthase [Ornithinimicrobium tianjinense]|uniref:Precorrin-3B synthase n=2 Tax=Ornithinimicrobium tianjinense TaxID=1195761 RepID=A0A917F9V7_9MICO|nr:precorrin-3B synthase [Ornithinimicrobium tianjinense]